MAAGSGLGMLTFLFASRRRSISKANIALCFSNKTKAQQNQMVRRSFIELGRGSIETAWAWYAKQSMFTQRLHVIGQPLIEQAKKRGRGILLIGGHFSLLDAIAPCVHPSTGDLVITYRPPPSDALDQVIRERRGRYGVSLNVRSTRQIVKKLHAGAVVWFSPDQDMGRRGCVFAPFLGQPASTTTSVAKMCRLTNAIPLFIHLHRANSEYILEFKSFPPEYPQEDEVANATTLNTLIENAILKSPDQYMWIHRRFKTTSDGSRQTLYQSS